MAGCATCLHKNVHPNVCSDCLGGTHFKPRIKTKTNADRIRGMSDEELAKYLDGVCHDLWQMFVADPEKMWLEWLKKEADEKEM